MKRSDKAVEFFKNGCNCAQAVVCAYAEDFGLDLESVKKLACGLGGGVGRTREVCGTVTGAAMVLGMMEGSVPAVTYPHVQDFIARFKAECGSVVCRELLAGTGATTGGSPDQRTVEYYKKRPCVELVRLAVELLESRKAEAADK